MGFSCSSSYVDGFGKTSQNVKEDIKYSHTHWRAHITTTAIITTTTSKKKKKTHLRDFFIVLIHEYILLNVYFSLIFSLLPFCVVFRCFRIVFFLVFHLALMRLSCGNVLRKRATFMIFLLFVFVNATLSFLSFSCSHFFSSEQPCNFRTKGKTNVIFTKDTLSASEILINFNQNL